jgi:surface antigen
MAYINSYPEPYRAAPLDAVVDRWLMYNRECTSYAAWMLEHINGTKINGDIPKKGTWVAKAWGTRAQELGYAVDKTPRVGSIANWTGGTYGHVAYVVAIEGSNVRILEYNYSKPGTWGERVVAISSVNQFIHFKGEDKAAAYFGDSSPVTPPAPAKKKYFIVDKAAANVRMMPSLSAPIVASKTLRKGNKVEFTDIVAGQVTQGNGGKWYRTAVSGLYVSTNGTHVV